MKYEKIFICIVIATVLFPKSIFGQPECNSLMGHWPFHEGGGDTAYDVSGKENHGIIIGAVPTEDRFGNSNAAYYFNGVNDYIEVPDDETLNPLHAITVEAWVCPTDVTRPKMMAIVDKFGYRGYLLGMNNDNFASQEAFFQVEFMNQGEEPFSVKSTTKLNNNQWYHVMGIYDGKALKIYINGIQEDSLAVVDSIKHADIEVGIGAALGTTENYFFQGSIDEVKICDGEIPPTPICRISMENIIEEQEQCYKYKPCFTNLGFDDSCGLDDGWYQIDSYSGDWSHLFTNAQGQSWFGNGWCLPELVFTNLCDGNHVIFFKVSDDSGNVEGESGEWSWRFCKDTIFPNVPDSVQSFSHTPEVWSNDNTVDVTWFDATDLPEGCGVEGYCIVWDTLDSTHPTIEDTFVGVESTTSPPLLDGCNHYFHIRTKDMAGNLADSTVHVGPFYIDTTRPIVTLACEDTVLSIESLCWDFLGEDNLTESHQLLYSYHRVGEDSKPSPYDSSDSICWKDIPPRSGPYTLWVKAKDLAGNISTAGECIFSYFPVCKHMIKGDPNCDSLINVLDVLVVVRIILGTINPTGDEFWRADCNGPQYECDGDGRINVIDAIKIVNIILELDQCP